MVSLQSTLGRVPGRWIFVIGFLLCCGLYEYGRVLNLRPLPMHLWRQADCLSLTWNYYTGEATFLEPQIHSRIADGGASGKSAGELPLLYWTVGNIWKITGPSEFVYRLLGLLLHFLASYCLYRTLLRLFASEFWAIATTLLLFTSPVLVTYSISFLPDVPALDLSLIGWYFVVRHGVEQRRRWWVIGMLFFSLATALKVTAGMSFVALVAILFLVSLRPELIGSLRRVFPSLRLAWASIALALVPVLAWYVHAEAYNQIHQGKYTFNSLWPLWEMTGEEINKALEFARDILVYQVFDTTIWSLLAVALLMLIMHVRQLPLGLILFNGLLLIGLGLYIIFWFHAVDGHDYYFINPIITLLVLLVTWLWWLKERHPDIFHARWIKWAFTGLLLYNVAYASNNLTMRSNAYSYMDRKDLLPVYHCQEPAFWNSIAFNRMRDLHTITPYLRELGVQPGDPVIYLDDQTINASLYFMQQPGYTAYGHDWSDPAVIQQCIEKGAKYMVFVEESWLQVDHLRPFLSKPIGKFGETYVFDMRELGIRLRTEIIYRQGEGDIPFSHRVNGVACVDGRGWCFTEDEWPLEIDDLPLMAPDMYHSELRVRGDLRWYAGYAGDSWLVLAEKDENGPVDHRARPLGEGGFDFKFKVPPRTTNVRNKLYFWNKGRSPFSLDAMEIKVTYFLPVE